MYSPVGQVKKAVVTCEFFHFKPGLAAFLPQYPATSLMDVKIDLVSLEFLAVV